MTKKEFKRRWESDKPEDAITYDDIAQCASEWGIFTFPRTHDIFTVRRRVLEAANCKL